MPPMLTAVVVNSARSVYLAWTWLAIGPDGMTR